MHRWTASELERRLGEAGESETVIAAHRLAADYWRWRVDVWLQERHADVHDLLEARHHLLATDDPEAAGAVTEVVCSRLHAWGAWEQESELVRDTLARLSPDGERAAAWTHQLGILAQDRGDLSEAETQYRRALDISERLGNQAGMAASYRPLGMLAHARGDLSEADTQYRRSLDIDERLGNQAGMATSISQLGILAAEREQLEAAIGLHGRALLIRAGMGIPQVQNNVRKAARAASTGRDPGVPASPRDGRRRRSRERDRANARSDWRR